MREVFVLELDPQFEFDPEPFSPAIAIPAGAVAKRATEAVRVTMRRTVREVVMSGDLSVGVAVIALSFLPGLLTR